MVAKRSAKPPRPRGHGGSIPPPSAKRVRQGEALPSLLATMVHAREIITGQPKWDNKCLGCYECEAVRDLDKWIALLTQVQEAR